jgi:hypothetical protein
MRAANIWHLGVKELRSRLREPMLLVLIVYIKASILLSPASRTCQLYPFSPQFPDNPSFFVAGGKNV